MSGVIMGFHIDADETGWLEPSSMTSLMPLWLAVLIADGEDPSMTFSFPSWKDICCWKPFIHSKLSSIGWFADTSEKAGGNGEAESMAMACGESL